MKTKISKSLAAILLTQVSLFADTVLDDVDVTVTSASGYEQNLTDASATISVITKEEIEKKSYSDITDVLKNIPGVTISGGGANQSILIRGMSTDYTLFLIDGRPMQNADAFTPNGNLRGVQMNFLPSLESIERIEVIRGPASGLYGSDAMGGVINIITKKNNSKKVEGGISLEYIIADKKNEINNNAYNTSVYLNAPLVEDYLSVSLNGTYNYIYESDYHATSTESSGSDPEYKNRNFGSKFTLTPNDNNTLTFGYIYSKQDRDYHVGKSLAETAVVRGVETALTDVSYDSYKSNYSLTHDANYENFLIKSYLNYDYAKNPSRTNATTGNGIKADTLSANTQGTYFFESHSTTVGANFKKENLNDGATSALNDDIVKMSRDSYALFGEDEWALNDDLILSLSARFDKNEEYGGNLSPKAYAVYHLSDNFTLKGGVITGYKAPSLRMVATDFASTSRGGVMIGNPDLKPEKSISYETGIAYDNSDIGLKGSLTVYKTDFKDKLATTDLVCQPNEECTINGVTYAAHAYGYRLRENIDEVELLGVELTTDYDITQNISYKHSYTFSDSEQKSGSSAGMPLNDLPKHMFNASINWDKTNNLNLWAQMNYRGKTVGDTSGVTQPEYTFADLGGVYKFDKKTKLKAGIYNIANKSVTTDNNTMILDGRRFSMAIDIKF